MNDDGNTNVGTPASTGTEGVNANVNAKEGTPENSQSNPADNPFNFPSTESESNTQGTEGTQGTEEEKTPVVPEKYTFTLPEGLSMSPEIESRFTELAKGMKLTQEQADGLVKLHSDIMMETLRSAEKQKNVWAEECQKAGLTTKEKMSAAKLAIDSFDETGKVMQELIDSGVAYSPNVQRFLQLIGSYLVEDNAPDSKPAPTAKSAADLLFSNSKY